MLRPTCWPRRTTIRPRAILPLSKCPIYSVCHRPLQNEVSKALNDRITHINSNFRESGEEDAFFVADLGQIYRQHELWLSSLRRVKPYYAIKCNPDPGVLRFLAMLDIGFDCGSKNEIQQALDIGVEPSRIIYANPGKSKSHIQYAAQKGVKQTTFDNIDELYKIKEAYSDAELLLRIMTDDSSARCPLSSKYGASLHHTKELLESAKELELNIVGVSFHIGSGALDARAFPKAVEDARVVFDQAAELGFHFTTLDVGGGFSSGSFVHMASVLNEALDKYFPSDSLKIIGEPGRYYVESAFTLACQVIARSKVKDAISQQVVHKLFLNDGVYGNFSGIIFDHQCPIPKVLRNGSNFLYGRKPKASDHAASPPQQYSLWGPTCDGLDMINENCWFPETLNVGDWLYFENMGGPAYTRCSATRFNSFNDNHDILYANSEPVASTVFKTWNRQMLM